MLAHSLLTPRDEDLTSTQHGTLVLLERIGGSISLVAVLLIFVAYALAPRVRNVQNTFIVFASISNIGASIASLIALDGVEQGVDSSLCQGQGFLFQMFMQSDPWWSLAMAFNVFLVFFFRTSPDAFRKWWWLYCLICYGGPFVIALTLLLVRNPRKGKMYGSATIWCWVDTEWENVRIYSYYMLIWICIVGSLIFYFMVGYHVFHSRNRLKSISASKSREAGTNEQKPRVDFLVPQDCFYGRIVTEVQVVQSTASSSALPTEPKTAYKQPLSPNTSFEMSSSSMQPPSNQYFSNFSTVTSAPAPTPKRRQPLQQIKLATSHVFSKFVVDDPIKRAYLRTSLLFALSVLATWIPSSMNRIHSWLLGDSPYEYHVATAAVLPLQGLWNAVIFFITSSHALRETWKHRRDEPGQAQQQQQLTGDMADTGVVDRLGSTEMSGGIGGSSFLDDSESGSDVELRRMAEAPGKRSASM
ncbi:hypothetical protein B0T10DRAFT_557933 [Thelonectria olida]|uniref:G-protein coupled receptors family 2 profile 2 domain-containing protein n=1 Tax=Thelonectria olida TaxID=1576542 RepID=A0A9P8WEU4_9HYPO|nr:hypothetical protein B0T10DRAFT_557933 [Thelonectria olida]